MNRWNYAVEYMKTTIIQFCFRFLFAVTLIGAIAGLIIIILQIRKLNKSGLAICLEKNASGILFGMIGPFVVCSPEKEETHVGVWGGSGTGKTRSIVLPTIHHWGRGNTVFTIDISGDISSNLRGSNNIIYRPAHSTIPYSPLYEVDIAKGRSNKRKALDNLVDVLMPPKENNRNENFYYDSGRQILKSAFYVLYPRGLDFCEICRKICMMSPEEFKHLVRLSNNEDAIMCITSLSDTQGTTFASCKLEAENAVRLFAVDEDLSQTVRRPEKNEQYIVPEVLERWNLHLVVSESENRMYHDLLHMITGQCFQYAFIRKLYPTNKILFCLDEFSSLGFLDIERPLDKFRKTGNRIIILAQSPLHVDIAYTTLHRRAMTENLRMQVIMECNDASTQKELFDRMGTPCRWPISKAPRIKEPKNLASMGDYVCLLFPGGSMLLKKIRKGI